MLFLGKCCGRHHRTGECQGSQHQLGFMLVWFCNTCDTFDCVHEYVQETEMEHEVFLGLRKNVLLYADDLNPIHVANRQHNIYLVGSDCCLASYANSVPRSKANCKIVELPPDQNRIPGGWEHRQPFTSLSQWEAVISQPLLCLRLLKNVREGDELLAHYPFAAVGEHSASNTQRPTK